MKRMGKRAPHAENNNAKRAGKGMVRGEDCTENTKTGVGATWKGATRTGMGGMGMDGTG
jgi:hypothetical protein